MPRLAHKKINQQGFTLIETLIYIAIAGIILSTITALVGASFTTRIKNNVIEEVELQGAQIALRITQSARGAEGISLPLSGDAENFLTLDLPGTDTETYLLNGETLQVIHNSSPVDLHSSNIIASPPIFRNLTIDKTEGTVQFEFTLTYRNQTGRNEYDYSKKFVGSATLYYLNKPLE